MKSAPERLWPAFSSKLIGMLPYLAWTIAALAGTGEPSGAPSAGPDGDIHARSTASPVPTPNLLSDRFMSFSFPALVRARCVAQEVLRTPGRSPGRSQGLLREF